MTKRVPQFVAAQYRGGAHEFRARKRKLARLMHGLLKEMRHGAAYFPDDGYNDLKMIEQHLTRLRDAVSVKVWGR